MARATFTMIEMSIHQEDNPKHLCPQTELKYT